MSITQGGWHAVVLQNAWNEVLAFHHTQLPGHVQQLRNAANRKITG